jgi:hypothetical protein
VGLDEVGPEDGFGMIYLLQISTIDIMFIE